MADGLAQHISPAGAVSASGPGAKVTVRGELDGRRET